MSTRKSNLPPARRPASPPRPPHAALSVARGVGLAPKDFDWIEKNIPCQAACPAKTDIPAYLDAIAHGDYLGAYMINLRDNVFPAVLGRVCTRPCEPACRHGWKGLGEPVAICFSKRSAADFLNRNGPIVLEKLFPPSGKRVAIVGAGAAGLAAARELALWGHSVTVFEKESEPGGLMRYGIPSFRLPREILAREIEQIACLGVEIVCRRAISDAAALDALKAEYDAVLLACGTWAPNPVELSGGALRGVRHGLDFLREANTAPPRLDGLRVVVIGGGFTAVDCARMAKRLGAASVQVFYRRSRREMYITAGEVEELEREGIAFHEKMAPLEALGAGGHVSALRVAQTAPGGKGPDGRHLYVPDPSLSEVVPADLALFAIGQKADTAWMPETWRLKLTSARAGAVELDQGLFAAGDFAGGARSLIDAIADGKMAARRIDRYLTGRDRFRFEVHIEDAEATGRTREMDAWPRHPMPALPVSRRTLTAEVDVGYDAETAKKEARRCYLCHFKYEIDNELCIYCDRCLKVKPLENCIVKVRSLIYDECGRIVGYHRSTGSKDYNLLFIDQSQCIRCGACKDVCPVDCIDLQKVSLHVVPDRGVQR